MKSPKLYMIVKVVLLTAVIFFSSGFTTILKYCAMSRSSQCCCSEHPAAQSKGLSLNGLNPSCMTVKVIGGLSGTKATITPKSFIKSLTIVAIVPHSGAISFLSAASHSLSANYANDAAPPGAEIYIRIGSLLI